MAPHRAERAPRPEGGDSSDTFKQGLSGSAKQHFSLSFLTELEGSLSPSWNLLPEIASLPPQTPGSSWAATRLQGCPGLCHRQRRERHFVQELKGGNRFKITTCSSKILLCKWFWHPLVGREVNTGFRHLKSFFLAAPHLEPYTTARNALLCHKRSAGLRRGLQIQESEK